MIWLRIFLFLAATASLCAAHCVYEEESGDDDTNVVGALTESNNHDDRKQMARLINDIWNAMSTVDEYYHLTCLRSLKQQIVAGIKYVARVEFTRTSCNKRHVAYDTYDETSCVDATISSHECTISIWLKPWENFIQINEYNCDPDFKLDVSKSIEIR